jgi:predicted kinase
MLISGLPGTGKSTLARLLAQRYALPLICKDTIKEPLFDVIGAADRAASRRLSDASFAAMFALARDCLRAGSDLILEGNFRPGDHEAALIAALPAAAPSTAAIASLSAQAPSTAAAASRAADPALHAAPAPTANIAQILCVASEPVRIARLKSRATDLSRHPGHRDATFVQDTSSPPGDFLELPGLRRVLDGDGLSPADTHDRRVLELLDALDQWRREA